MYDNSGIERYKNKGSFLLLFRYVVRLLRLKRRKAQGASKKKKALKKTIATLWCPSVDRSGGPIFPAVSSAG